MIDSSFVNGFLSAIGDKAFWVILLIILTFCAMVAASKPAKDPWERCLRNWPLAECQARKDAGVL